MFTIKEKQSTVISRKDGKPFNELSECDHSEQVTEYIVYKNNYKVKSFDSKEKALQFISKQ